MAVSQSLTLTQVSQSVVGNSSQVRILWTSTQTGESYNIYKRTAKYYVSVNGGAEVVYSVTYNLPKQTTATILDTTITVPHTAAGAGQVKVRTWMDTDISAGVVQKESVLTLTTIPRATTPTFSASSADMGSKVTITMNRAVSSFVHDLYYSFAGAAFVYIAGDLGTSYSWTVPDLATRIPNATSGALTVRCVTRSGSTTIGTKDVVFTAKVPGSVMPTISSVTTTEATADLAAQFGAFVKNHSTLAVAVTAAGAKGSTIVSCTSTLDGVSYTGLRFTSGVLTTAGTLNLVTTVTDSRRRSVKLTTKIAVVDYYPPETSKLVVYRVDADGNAKNDGKYLCVDYAYKVAPVGNKNTSTMTMSAKRSIDTAWTTILTGSSYNNAAVRKFDKEYTTDYQFDIKIEVVDWFGAKAEYIATLPTAKVIMDLKANGRGVAFGKTSEFDGFELAMPANGESFKLAGVRSYELGDAYGHVLYNNGLLLQWGMVSVTPTAINTVTQLRVVFPIAYAYRPHITGTLLSNTPKDVDWALGVGGSETEARTGLVVYATRGSMYAAPIRWMAVGQADLTKLPEVTAE